VDILGVDVVVCYATQHPFSTDGCPSHQFWKKGDTDMTIIFAPNVRQEKQGSS